MLFRSASARRQGRLDDIVREVGAENVVAVAGDVIYPEVSERLVESAIERFGRLDSLVAAAGVGMYGGVLDHSDEELVEMASANYLGTVWSVRAAVPRMKEQGGGDIVVIASVAGLLGVNRSVVREGSGRPGSRDFVANHHGPGRARDGAGGLARRRRSSVSVQKEWSR